MRTCKKRRKDLVAYLSGELPQGLAAAWKEHLEECPACRSESERIQDVFREAGKMEEDIRRVMAGVDWEGLPARIADAVERTEVPAKKPSAGRTRSVFRPALRPVLAGLLAGVAVGSLLTLFIFRTAVFRAPENGRILVPRGFYEKMELEMARRETIDYLNKSEYLLLDFIQTPAEKTAEFWRSEYASERTKALLSQKRYIDSQLDEWSLAKAKAICDQIELLLLELSQTARNLPAGELEKLQDMVEEKQLLLKIKLVKRELEQNEV